MSKTIPSPFLPTAPTRVRALGDSPCHALHSFCEDMAVYPVAMTTAAGPVLSAARGSERLAFVLGAGNSVDVQVPPASPRGTNSFFARSSGVATTVDKTNVGIGTINVDLGAPPADVQGYFALQNLTEKVPEPRVIIAVPIPDPVDMWDARDAAARSRYATCSPIQELVLAALRWKMSAAAVVDQASVAGGLAFNITKGATGVYDVTFSFQIPPGAVLIATARGAFCTAVPVGAGGNTVRVSSFIAGVAADVPITNDIALLVLAPRTGRGIKNQLTSNRTRYTSGLRAIDGTYPAMSTFRDAVFLPFNIRTTGAGIIAPTDPLTVVPPNVEIYQDNTAGVIAIDIGRCSPELCVASFYINSAGSALAIDYSQLATKGRLLVTTAPMAAALTISGYILQGVTRER